MQTAATVAQLLWKKSSIGRQWALLQCYDPTLVENRTLLPVSSNSIYPVGVAGRPVAVTNKIWAAISNKNN